MYYWSKTHVRMKNGRNVSLLCRALHRGWKGPFNTFSKNIFSKRASVDQNWPNDQILCMDHYIGQQKSQKGSENVEKSHEFGLKHIFQKKKLSWLI